MAVRVAVADFHNEVQSAPMNAMLGEIGPLYRERLTEVLLIMGVASVNGLFPMG
jgi:hypothetical protein